MNFDVVEKLKREWTDRYVVVDPARTELARFAGRTGQVRTVNMSGRALVRFDGADEAWYDIGLDFLRVAEKPSAPAPSPPPAKAVAKPAKPAQPDTSPSS